VYANSVGIPSFANVIKGSFFLSSSFFFKSSFSFLVASLSSFLLFFSRNLGEKAPIVALSSLFLFFFVALASPTFLASSFLCASVVVSPTYNVWPKMAVKDANPSGVLVSIVDSSESFKWLAIIFINLSSLLSPLLDPEPRPPVLAIVIHNLLSAASFPSTILEQIWEWIQIPSPVLKDFQQFRACDVIRIATCDTLFLAKESGFQKWLMDAFSRAVQCC
jgi:hypothetical protein